MQTVRRPGAAVVATTGDLDAHTAPALREVLGTLADEDTRDAVVVDLSATDFIDSSGLGALVEGVNRLGESERRLALVCTKPHLLKVLQITKLDKVIPVAASVEDALGG